MVIEILCWKAPDDNVTTWTYHRRLKLKQPGIQVINVMFDVFEHEPLPIFKDHAASIMPSVKSCHKTVASALSDSESLNIILNAGAVHCLQSFFNAI